MASVITYFKSQYQPNGKKESKRKDEIITSTKGPLDVRIISTEGPFDERIISTKRPLDERITSTKGPLDVTGDCKEWYHYNPIVVTCNIVNK